jgi:hypothetical protein
MSATKCKLARNYEPEATHLYVESPPGALESERYPGRLISFPRAVRSARVPTGDRAALVGRAKTTNLIGVRLP